MTTCRKPARRAYYVRYPRRFANEYDLRYTVGGADLPAGDGWERITRRLMTAETPPPSGRASAGNRRPALMMAGDKQRQKGA